MNSNGAALFCLAVLTTASHGCGRDDPSHSHRQSAAGRATLNLAADALDAVALAPGPALIDWRSDAVLDLLGGMVADQHNARPWYVRVAQAGSMAELASLRPDEPRPGWARRPHALSLRIAADQAPAPRSRADAAALDARLAVRHDLPELTIHPPPARPEPIALRPMGLRDALWWQQEQDIFAAHRQRDDGGRAPTPTNLDVSLDLRIARNLSASFGYSRALQTQTSTLTQPQFGEQAGIFRLGWRY